MSDGIPPRPWRVDINERADNGRGAVLGIEDAQGRVVVDESDSTIHNGMSRQTAELIVRLVNAEPEIVAALEAAERLLEPVSSDDGECEHGMWWETCPNDDCATRERRKGFYAVRAALARLKP